MASRCFWIGRNDTLCIDEYYFRCGELVIDIGNIGHSYEFIIYRIDIDGHISHPYSRININNADHTLAIYGLHNSLKVTNMRFTLITIYQSTFSHLEIMGRVLTISYSRIGVIHARLLEIELVRSRIETGNLYTAKIFTGGDSYFKGFGYSLYSPNKVWHRGQFQIMKTSLGFQYIRGQYIIPCGRYVLYKLSGYPIVMYITAQWQAINLPALVYHRRKIYGGRE